MLKTKEFKTGFPESMGINEFRILMGKEKKKERELSKNEKLDLRTMLFKSLLNRNFQL